MDKQQQIYQHLEDIAQEQDPWIKQGEYYRESTANLLSLIQSVPHKSILEVGCAQGDFTKELAKIAGYVDAIDVSESEIKRARKNCRRENIFFWISSLEEVPRRMDMYDVIVCSEVLYYILDKNKALNKLQRLGKYVVTSNFLIYGNNLSLGSMKYELALRRFPLVKRIIEKSWKDKYLVIKSLRKL